MTWHARYPDEATCIRCLVVKPVKELDRLLWCDECRANGRKRALRQSYLWGLGAAVLLAIWIWLYIQPSDLVLGGWIATVVASFWATSRVAREIIYGVMRFSSRKAIEARPPEAVSEGSPEAE